jgi:ubiquinone/menaquinone biosynthesis C-methylase UbiE
VVGLKKVQAHYDEVAEIYDGRYDGRRGRDYHGHLCQRVMAWLPPGRRLLDLGCGTGLFIERYIAESGSAGSAVSNGSAVGLDISTGMIEKARLRSPASDFLVGTAEVLPFKDAEFDAIASMLAFSYVPHPERMLAEAYRVLRPGGAIAICTLGKNALTSVVPAIYRIGEKMDVHRIGMGDFGEHYYNEQEMEVLFVDAGFTDIAVQRCSFAHLNLATPLYDLAKKVEPFIEARMPYLAYNICAAGTKPR